MFSSAAADPPDRQCWPPGVLACGGGARHGLSSLALVATLALAAAGAVGGAAPRQSVDVEFYGESLCPFCAKYTGEQAELTA